MFETQINLLKFILRCNFLPFFFALLQMILLFCRHFFFGIENFFRYRDSLLMAMTFSFIINGFTSSNSSWKNFANWFYYYSNKTHSQQSVTPLSFAWKFVHVWKWISNKEIKRKNFSSRVSKWYRWDTNLLRSLCHKFVVLLAAFLVARNVNQHFR